MGFLGFLLDLVANLLAGWIAEILTPLGMTGFAIALLVTVAFVAYWHRKQREAKKLGMASLGFIIFSGVVALLAVGAFGFGLALKFSGIQTAAANPHTATLQPPPLPVGPPSVVPAMPTPPSPAKPKYVRAEAEALIPTLQRIRSIIQNDLIEGIARKDLPNFQQTIEFMLRPPGRVAPGAQQTQQQINSVITSQINVLTTIRDAINSGINRAGKLMNSDEYRDHKDTLSPIISQLWPNPQFVEAIRDYIDILNFALTNSVRPDWVLFRQSDTTFRQAYHAYLAHLKQLAGTVDAKIFEIRENTQ